MWLLRCTETRCLSRRAASLRAAGAWLATSLLVLMSACASGPATAPAPAGDTPEPAAAREVPPRVLTLYEQATAAMAAGEDLDAELRFREFLSQHPDWPGAWINLAILAARNGDDLAAESHLQGALRLDPAHPAALNQLGMLKRRQGAFEEAESAYLKAVTASPEYALAHYNLGVLNELYLQRLDTALLHFERYLELGGDDAEVEKWIADLKRRVAASQRTANVTE